MKMIFSTLLIFIHFLAFGQEKIDIGNNIKIYYEQLNPKYLANKTKLSAWYESEIYAYSGIKNPVKGDKVVLVALNKYPFGILQTDENGEYLLIDTEGDNNLDLRTDLDIIIPFWIISKETNNKTKINNVEEYLNQAYNNFKSDDGPYFNNRIYDFIKKIDDKFGDANTPNRDLLYALIYYYKLSVISPKHAFTLLGVLLKQYFERFNKDNNLFLLHLAETMINLCGNEQARKVIDRLLELDKDYVPAQVYRYQLENDPTKKEKLLLKLKSEHPKHWMVPQM